MTDSSNTVPRRAVTGDEADAYGRYWRRWVNWRPGERAAIKARTNRRERRERRDDARRQVIEEVSVGPRCTLTRDGATEVHVYSGEPAAGDTCACGAVSMDPDGWVGIPVGPSVLRCDGCSVTSEDWRRDRSAPVTYFVRDGLCSPCSRRAAPSA